VAAERKRFIVLILADRENYGFDEQTLPPLVALMDSASPDQRQFCHSCVTGYFLTSRDSLTRVEGIIQQAERLRTTDSRFSSLGVGLAEGSMLADFTVLERLKPEMTPLGTVANNASRSARILGGYQQPLKALRHEFVN
jgi:hypothetical protein